MEDRPEPDLKKLAGQFDEWLRGDTLVGRMLANLKTGRMPDVLAGAVADGSGGGLAEPLSEVWNAWERGTALPLPTAEGLRDGDLAEFLADLGDMVQEQE